MPRSFLIKKNYSHCPLKKRPVLKLDDERDVADNSEPENLSTKPEDLSMSAAQHQFPHKAITPPPGVALISSVKREPLAHAPAAALNHQSAPLPGLASPPPPPQHPAFFAKSSSGGPLEPLNLNTPAEPTHHHHHHHHHPTTHPAHPQPTHPAHAYGSPPPAWPPRAAVAPHYPPPYFTFNYPYPPPADLYSAAHHPYPPAVLYPLSPARSPLQEQLSPYAPRDTSSASPPHPYMTPPVDAPKLYMPWAQTDHCGLSPTSSVASSSSHTAFQSSSPPPATPEDLSSPGSVSSGSSSSAGSTSAGSKKRKDAAPRHQCPDCSKSYSTYSGLSKHQQFHCAASAGAQAKKSFSCKYCEKVYVSLGALKMHIRTHTLPCKCRICGKAFSRPWLLQGHIRTHTGEKPFSCPHCNRAFADRSNLRAHLQTHSDVKKYSCTSCSKTFSRMSLLTKHTEGGCPGVATAAQLGALQPREGVATLLLEHGGAAPAGHGDPSGVGVPPLMAPQEVKAYP